MWMFTKKGFISIVQDRDDEDMFIVRARAKSHLTKLFPGKRIFDTPEADYAFRVRISRSQFAEWMVGQTMEIDYDNFKGAIKEEEYHTVCLDVWGSMMRYQIRKDHRGTRKWLKSLKQPKG